MKTVIELPDELLKQAQSTADLQGISLREFFVLAVQSRIPPEKKIKVRRPPPTIGDPNGPVLEPPTREQIDEAMLG
jgi:hypothetical protein